MKSNEKGNQKGHDESSIPIFSQWRANAGWQDAPQSDAASGLG
jgi:hypothetical protein